MPEPLDAWITLAADAVLDPAALPPREALLGMLRTTFDATQVSLTHAPGPATPHLHRLDLPVENGNGRWVVVLTRPAPSFTDHERRRAGELRPLLCALLAAAERREDDARLPSVPSPLTPREADVLAHLESGLTATAIGRRLGVSPRTVRKHLENVYRKFDVQDRVSAVVAARERGLLQGRVPDPGPGSGTPENGRAQTIPERHQRLSSGSSADRSDTAILCVFRSPARQPQPGRTPATASVTRTRQEAAVMTQTSAHPSGSAGPATPEAHESRIVRLRSHGEEFGAAPTQAANGNGAPHANGRREPGTPGGGKGPKPPPPRPTAHAFGYMFSSLAAGFPSHHLSVDDPQAMTAALTALGDAMSEPPPQAPTELQAQGNSTIPAVYTYWGQFIDHDVTAKTDRITSISQLPGLTVEPHSPAEVVPALTNGRQPALNLDSLYGDGPSFRGAPSPDAAAMYDGPRFRLGATTELNDDGTTPGGQHVTAVGDTGHDLPRSLPGAEVPGRAIAEAVIGDGRNDENLVIAQFHVAFLRFHNAVVDWVQANERARDDRAVFERAKQLVQWHYQWLVVHDFLETVCQDGVVDQVLLGGNRFFPTSGPTFMPLEFSVAAFRFGHSMIRGAYDFNRNFGRPDPVTGGTPVIPSAPFRLLFAFTGGARNLTTHEPAPFNGRTKVLPFNWVIEWDRFTDKGSTVPDRFARSIDTKLTPPLAAMGNQVDPGSDAVLAQVQQHLARRNLMRGYSLGLPTGQAVAQAMGLVPLTPAELASGGSPELVAALQAQQLDTATPLWFYLLKEAEVRAGGNSLGPVGSRIVAETLIGQILHDPTSYLRGRGERWNPSQGVRLPDGSLVVTISDLFRFAGVL